MLRIVRDDEICQRLMSIPGVGLLVAITFKSAIDDPGRIAKSKTIGALFGLVPKKYQSGERDVSGGITRTGDESVRTALYEAANVMLTRTTRFSSLKTLGTRGGEAARSEARTGCAGAQAGSRAAPHLGRRNDFQVDKTQPRHCGLNRRN